MGKGKRKGLAHVGIERRTLKEEHWRGLSAAAKIFYIHLKGHYNGENNGEIELSYSKMRTVRDCSSNPTLSKAIKELENKGWIIRKKIGGMYRHKNLYKLTFKYDFYAMKLTDGPGKG